MNQNLGPHAPNLPTEQWHIHNSSNAAFTLLEVTPRGERGYVRLVTHDNTTGAATGHLDIEATAAAYDAHALDLATAGVHVLNHNVNLRNASNDDTERRHQLEELKQRAADEATPPPVTHAQQQQGIAAKEALVFDLNAQLTRLQDSLSNKHHHRTRAKAYLRERDDARSLGITDTAPLDEKIRYHEQLADQAPALQDQIDNLTSQLHQALDKPASTYYREAQQ